VMDSIHGLGDLSVEGGLLRADSRQHEGQEVRGGLFRRLRCKMSTYMYILCIQNCIY
jgi:hypothetical protein